MGSEVEDGTRRGITRRDVIKGGAALGGVVWAAPIIDSFISPVSAGSSPCGAFTACSYADCTLCSGGTRNCTRNANDYEISCPSIVTPQGCLTDFAHCCCSAGNCPSIYPPCTTTSNLDTACPVGAVPCG